MSIDLPYQVSSAIFLFLLVSSVVLFKRAGLSNTGRSLVAFIAAVQLMMFGVFLVSNYFTARGFDDSVLYHLKFGLSGAGFSEYSALTVYMSVYLIVAAAVPIAIFDFLGKSKLLSARFFLKRVQPKTALGPALVIVGKVSASSALFLSLVANPLSANIYALLQRFDADRFLLTWVNHYELPLIPKIPAPKNIVYIYLEGLERTYFDETLFPGLVPNLSRLEAEALSFVDIGQARQTEWTVAGMVASQCGIPMFTPAQGNTMGNYDRFLPSTVCLGDILKENGYRLLYMGGADKDFAGKGSFYKSHGFQSVTGRDELIGGLDDPEYLSGWGLYDDSLFERVSEKFLDFAEDSDPFALFALTLDTHSPNGHVSKSCRDSPYMDGSNPILNAVACSDRLVARLVESISKGPHSDDTIIVVSSDHLAMRNSVYDQLRQGNRKNFLIVIDPDAVGPETVARPGSMLDVAPTLLSLLGVDMDGLGFGKNLLGEAKTLREHLPQDYNALLRTAGEALRADLWSYPAIGSSVAVDLEQREVVIKDRQIGFPVLLLVNDRAEVEDIKFTYHSRDGDAVHLNDLVAKLSPSQAFLWIDACLLQPVSGIKSRDLRKVMPKAWCATYGHGEAISTKVLGAATNNEILVESILLPH